MTVCLTTAIALDLAFGAAAAVSAPKRLAVYYGYPSLVEGADGDVTRAVRTFADYDAIVFGDGLELGRESGDAGLRAEYGRLIEIVPRLHTAPRRPTVWGYIDLGRTQNLTIEAIVRRIDAWKTVGADGVFFDEAGADFGVTPARRSAVVRAAHERALRVFMNAFNPDDLFDGATSRPSSPGALTSGDALLIESFGVREGVTQSAEATARRAQDALKWRGVAGVSVFAVTTTIGRYDRDAFAFAWHQAAALGLDGIGWGEPGFSTDSRLPWRERPGDERPSK